MNATTRTLEEHRFDSRVEPLPDGKVRLEVTIPSASFERDLDAAFRKLAREVRVPGFRPGKAPRRLLEAQFGTAPAREQALRDALPEYYAEAVEREHVDVIAAPELDITGGEDDGDVSFTAVVEVRPVVELPGYDSLQVVVEPPSASEEQVDARLEVLRNRFASIADSDEPLVAGDYARIELSGELDDEPVPGLQVSDFLHEVGSGAVVPGLDEALLGASTGDVLDFTDTLPDTVPEIGGQEVVFTVTVQGTQRKVLPELDDTWASDVSEFDTLEELRADVRRQVETMARLQARMAVRDKVIEAAVAKVEIEVPKALVDQEVRHRLQDLALRLQQQGASLDQYLAVTGDDPETFRAKLEEQSTEAVKADLALRAVIAAESIEADDDEVEAQIADLAARSGRKPDRVRKDLARNGAIEAIRSDIARTKALQFLVDHAEVVDEAGAPVDLSLPSDDERAAGSADPDATAASDDAPVPPEPTDAATATSDTQTAPEADASDHTAPQG
jgi:trigger factor